jgi:hypothetical protein
LIENDPADQNGFTLSGEIVTDGTLGNLSPSNITSWTYTITSSTTSATHSGTGPSGVAITGDVVATSTQITLAQPPLMDETATENTFLFGPDLSNGGTSIEYDRVTAPFSSSGIYVSPTAGTSDWIFSNTGGPLSGHDPWLIATVPEPSAAILGVIGAVSGIAYGWSCRRRAQRRQAAA